MRRPVPVVLLSLAMVAGIVSVVGCGPRPQEGRRHGATIPVPSPALSVAPTPSMVPPAVPPTQAAQAAASSHQPRTVETPSPKRKATKEATARRKAAPSLERPSEGTDRVKTTGAPTPRRGVASPAPARTEPKAPAPTAAPAAKPHVFVCPMHPTVQSSKLGACPECGMSLEAKQ